MAKIITEIRHPFFPHYLFVFDAFNFSYIVFCFKAILAHLKHNLIIFCFAENHPVSSFCKFLFSPVLIIYPSLSSPSLSGSLNSFSALARRKRAISSGSKGQT